MSRFRFVAVAADGTKIRDELDAMSETLARDELLSRNLEVRSIKSARVSILKIELTKQRVKRSEIMNFSRQMAAFVAAGIPLTEGLQVISRSTTNKHWQEVLADASEAIGQGAQFSDALERNANLFPPYYLGIIRAAELTGRLGVAWEIPLNGIAEIAMTVPGEMDPLVLAVVPARITRRLIERCGDIVRASIDGSRADPGLVDVSQEGRRRHRLGARAVAQRLDTLRALEPMTVDAATTFYFHGEGTGLLAGWSDPSVALLNPKSTPRTGLPACIVSCLSMIRPFGMVPRNLITARSGPFCTSS